MTLLWSCEAETTLKRLSELKSWSAQLQKKRLLDSQGTGWCSESEFAASRCERKCLEEDWAMEGNIFDHAKDFSDSRNEDVHSDIGQSSCHSVKLIFVSILSRWKFARAQSRSCLYWDSLASRPSKPPFRKTGHQQHITSWGFKEIAWGWWNPHCRQCIVDTTVSTIIVMIAHHTTTNMTTMITMIIWWRPGLPLVGELHPRGVVGQNWGQEQTYSQTSGDQVVIYVGKEWHQRWVRLLVCKKAVILHSHFSGFWSTKASNSVFLSGEGVFQCEC